MRNVLNIKIGLPEGKIHTSASAWLGFFPLVVLILCLASGYSEAGSLDGPAGMIRGRDNAEMVLVPAGDFLMGSYGDDYPGDERPRHKVFLRAFYIDRYEVTNELFVRFLNSVVAGKDMEKRKKWVVTRNDLDDPAKATWFPAEITFSEGKYRVFSGFGAHPALTVSWEAADEYCKWAGGRLPTEAEWEKAARGGLEGKEYPWGNQIPAYESGPIFARRWTDNSLPAPTGEVQKYPANGFGIYGMAGNALEWCSDWYSPGYYRESPGENPQGPKTGQRKVQRGGSWTSPAVGIRTAARSGSLPSSNSTASGFRCAMDADTVRNPAPGS